VLSFIVVMSILNLALGYAAAAALADPPPWKNWRLAALRRKTAREQYHAPTDAHAGPAVPERNPAARPPRAPAAPPSVTIAGIDELPKQWLDQLATAGVAPQSFLEGVAQVLRLEVGRYREQLVGWETRCRSLLAAADSDGLKLLGDDVRAANQQWLDQQTAAATMFSQRSGRLGDHEASAQALEQVLLDQAAQIGSTNTLLESLDYSQETESGGKQFLEQLATLIAAAHTLRDQMLDLVATLLRTGQRLNELGDGAQLEKDTRLPSRLGLEAILSAWWQGDPERARPLSLVQIDIDRFARVNQRLSTRAGDRALVAAAALIEELIHKDRENDRICRTGGQTLLVVMGDTGPHEALAAAERLRQSFEATTFDDHGATFELTLSCGVVDAGHGDSISALLGRCLAAVQFAKKAGRNRCSLDEGQGPTTLEAPQFPVKGRVVSIGE
jgi:diguanylate cyclase